MRRSTRALVGVALVSSATSSAENNSTDDDDTFGRDSLLSILDALPASASEECSSASAEVAFERANRLKSNRQLYGALGCYHRAITVDSNHASTYNNLANTIKRLDAGAINCGNKPCERDELTSAAIYSLRTVLSINPLHANAYTNLATLMRWRNRLSECIELNRIAVRLQPQHATAWENLGRALQADSAPYGVANSIEAAGGGADKWIMTEHGGVRSRERLEDAVDAFATVQKLLGERATADARRGGVVTNLWLGNTDMAAALLLAGREAGKWRNGQAYEFQYPGQIDPSLPSRPFPALGEVNCIPQLLEERAPKLIAEAAELLKLSVSYGESYWRKGRWWMGFWAVQQGGRGLAYAAGWVCTLRRALRVP